MAIANDNGPTPDDGILEWVAEQHMAGVDLSRIGDTLLMMALKLSMDAGGTIESCRVDFDIAMSRIKAQDERSYH